MTATVNAFAPLQLARNLAKLPCPDCWGKGWLYDPDSEPEQHECGRCNGLGTAAYEGEWPQMVWYHSLADIPPESPLAWELQYWLADDDFGLRKYSLPAPVLLGYDGTSGPLPWLCGLYGFDWASMYRVASSDWGTGESAATPLALVQGIIDWAHAKAGREPVQWEAA